MGKSSTSQRQRAKRKPRVLFSQVDKISHTYFYIINTLAPVQAAKAQF